MNEEDLYNIPQYPVMIVISGPSAVGKDTIARRLIERSPDSFYFVVTATTRDSRPGEVHGRDYFFVSNDEFARMIEKNELLEYAIVYNDYKGVPKQQIREALASGRDVVMRVDVQGAATIRRLVPNATLVYLMAESEAAMVDRLRARKAGASEDLQLRIATARQELKRIDEFDFCVINADGGQDKAVQEILCIMASERCRVGRQPVEL